MHVPGPGDVFTAENRSAVLTVARQLAAAHQRAGGDALMVAAAGVVDATWDGPPVVASQRHRTPLSRAERAVDLLAGRTLGVRPLTLRAYRGMPTTASDLVFLHAHPAALLSRHLAGTRVLYVHNESFRRLGRREVRAVGQRAAAVVSVSADLASRFPDLACPVVAVPNGADASVFFPGPGPAPGARPRLAYLGRVVPEKGVHVLVEAAAALRHLDFELDVVGSSGSPDLSAYERELRASAQPLGERVRFLRDVPRRQIGAHLRTCSVLVVPSVWREPLGLVVAEGIASGVAVVASRTGGIPEAGGDACTYVRPDDAVELAAALEELLTDPAALASARARARRRAPAVSWDSAYAHLVSELEGVGL